VAEKSALDILWVIVAGGLVFMMQAGFLCLETGLTRAKNSINVAMKNITDVGVAVLLYWMFGFALMFGWSQGGWYGSTQFFTRVGGEDQWLSAFFFFQAMFVATAATIVSGAVAERLKFGAYIVVTAIISGIIYPFFGHWTWGGFYEGPPGWLASWGFVDFAGSTVVHSVGGWVALAVLLVIGPRAGRFPAQGPPRPIPGWNLPIAMLGTVLLAFGWIGFNGGSTLEMNDQVAGIVANTILAACAGLVVALFVGWILEGTPKVDLPINGCLAGLVAITANCHAVDAASAVMIGGIGALVMLAGGKLLEYFRIDDAVGAIPVHMAAGVWGTIAVALFGNLEILGTGLDREAQLYIQVMGVLVCGLLSFSVSYVLILLLNRIYPLRVSPEEEIAGLDVSEHQVGEDSDVRSGAFSPGSPV